MTTRLVRSTSFPTARVVEVTRAPDGALVPILWDPRRRDYDGHNRKSKGTVLGRLRRRSQRRTLAQGLSSFARLYR